MPIVIDGLQLVNSKRRLPKEAFFVDTNVVIDFIDPFGRSLESPSVAERNEKIAEVLGKLKGAEIPYYATLGVVAEYYKHIQNGFYLIETRKKLFNSTDFKKLRNSDVDFMDRWEGQMEELRRVFTKKIPAYDLSVNLPEVITTFNGNHADFGDYLLYKTVMACPEKMRCVFSNDADFYSFPDDLYLLTTNGKVIKTGEKDNKLF